MGSLSVACEYLDANAWDTHVHVFDPSIGPYAKGRSYTPASATLDDLTRFERNLTQTRQLPNLVIVQPSPYGTDNRVLLRTLRTLTTSSAQVIRGIAVVDLGTVTDNELQEMHDAGVRGLRLNLQASGREVNIEALNAEIATAACRIAHLPGWMVQVYIPGCAWNGETPLCIMWLRTDIGTIELFDTISALPVVVIADHIGGLQGRSKLPVGTGSSPIEQPGYAALVELARRRKVIIKISGFYRASHNKDSAFDDLASIISALASEVPDQLIWASDWPHTGDGSNRDKRNIDRIEPFRDIDNLAILKELQGWVGSTAWEKMMVLNPARIYSTGQ
ncbi:amidohydrolase 2 [Paramyrothecium foliicola]|nr:amidohydrolase 2 [Paramyrothecium foliicola]